MKAVLSRYAHLAFTYVALFGMPAFACATLAKIVGLKSSATGRIPC